MATRTPEREQFLADVIVGCAEDYGYNQWREVFRYQWADRPPAQYELGIVEIGDGDEDTRHAIDIGVIARGIGRIDRGELRINGRLRAQVILAAEENDAGEIDAELADCILQAGLFGELVYG